jgi:hypothetical protein
MVPLAAHPRGADRTGFAGGVAGLRMGVAEQQQGLDKTLVPGANGDFRIGQ